MKSEDEIIRLSLDESVQILFQEGYDKYLEKYSYSKGQLKNVSKEYSGFFNYLKLKRQQQRQAVDFSKEISREAFDLSKVRIRHIEVYPSELNEYTFFNARIECTTDCHNASLSIRKISIVDGVALSTGIVVINVVNKPDDRDPIDFLLGGSWRRFIEGKDGDYPVGGKGVYRNREYHSQIHIYFRTTADDVENGIGDDVDEPPCLIKQEKAVELFKQNAEYFFEETTKALLNNFSKIVELYDDNYVYDCIKPPRLRLQKRLGKRENFKKDNLNLTMDDIVRIFSINALKITNKSEKGVNYMVFYFHTAFEPMNDVEITFLGKEIESMYFLGFIGTNV